jgi:hypothetical protein
VHTPASVRFPTSLPRRSGYQRDLDTRSGQRDLDQERRPIARQVIDISTANAHNRAGYRIDDELLLTATYRSTAVIVDPGAAPPATALDQDGYRPDCRPGRRLPHLPLTGGPTGATSALDLLGPGFTLLTATDSLTWRRQVEEAQRTGFPSPTGRSTPTRTARPSLHGGNASSVDLRSPSWPGPTDTSPGAAPIPQNCSPRFAVFSRLCDPGREADLGGIH